MRAALRCLVASIALAGCTHRTALLNRYTVPTEPPLLVAMEPALAQLEERVRPGSATLVVATGELLRYYFIGAAPGATPAATLHLVDSHLDVDTSGAKVAGALGSIATPVYLTMVNDYACKYSLIVEAVMPDGARHVVVGRGEGHANVDIAGAVREAVRQAAGHLYQQVAVLIAAPTVPANTTGAAPGGADRPRDPASRAS